MTAFLGAKLAILAGDRIVTILRDDTPDIPWPDHWDLPGGGREGDESPESCVLRELNEELGLSYRPEELRYRRSYGVEGGNVWFFVTEQPNFAAETVTFGNEGQTWRLAPITWFMEDAKTLPRFRARLADYFAAVGPR